MSIQVELRDYAGRKITFDQLSKRIKRLLSVKARNECWDVLDEGAINIRNNIIQGIRNSPPTGKMYYRGTRTTKKGKVKKIYHRASSPGNYPRTDSGDLVQSIKIARRTNEIEVGSRITDPAYPICLEKGTDKMDARPWLEPSFDQEEGNIKMQMNKVLRRAALDFAKGTG